MSREKRRKMKIEKSEMEADIRRVFDLIKHPPSRVDYFKFGKYGVNTIRRKWGTWNKALIEIIGSVNKNRNLENIICEIECPVCKKGFAKKGNQKYCSISCSNSDKPKRKITLHSCKTCSNIIPKRNMFCKNCKGLGRHLKGGMLLSEKTIEETMYRSDANKYGVIRCHARTVVKDRIQACVNCKYDTHIEVCHIKEIKDFPKTTLVKEVNSPNNLIILCPNCHWELDHGLLESKWSGRRDLNS
jgi:hypothetical protein